MGNENTERRKKQRAARVEKGLTAKAPSANAKRTRRKERRWLKRNKGGDSKK